MHLFKKCVVLYLLVQNSMCQDGCVLNEISSLDGNCVAELQCYSRMDDLESVVKNWNCIRIEGPLSYDYYTRQYRNKINYKSNYDLHINVTHIYDEDGFSGIPALKEHVKSIIFTNGNFVSIPNPLYNLPYVTEIEVTHNIVEKFSINNFLRNQYLKKINVSHNLISELDSESDITFIGNEDLSSLTSIDLSNNIIEELPDNMFVHVSQLQHLNLSHNYIKSFSILTFEGATQLQTLDISSNRIKEIGHAFVRFVNLKILYLDNNSMKTITGPNFVSMVKLEKLNLSSNYIENIEDTAFQSLSNVTDIDLSNNRINIITTTLFRNNSLIKSLSLRNNSIKIIETGSFDGKNITNFLFEKNLLSGSIKQNTFSGVNVRVLNLSGAQIESLSDEAFSTMNTYLVSLNLTSNKISNISKSAFETLHILNDLDLSNNYLTELNFKTEDLYGLSSLYVYNNKITKIQKSFFTHLVNLEILDLSQNLINEVEANSFDNLYSLKRLVLENNNLINNLDAYVFKGLTSLLQLELTNSRIQSYNNYSFSSMTNLISVNSSNGQLSNIQYNSFVNTSALEVLDLSYNLLENFTINTKNMKNLKKMFLNNNKIRKIYNETFFGLTSLSSLDISRNNLVEIESNAFWSLTKLLSLQMSSNPEMKISPTIFDNISELSKVSLENTKKSFSFDNATNTSIINVQLPKCNIVDIDKVYIYKIKNIVTLNLSSNKISFIDKFSFLNMSSLVNLDLSFNLIKDLQPGSFLGTDMINNLNLHSNYIESIQFGVLDGLEYLNSLNLSSNLLRSFEAKLLHKTPRVTILALDDNLIKIIRFYDFVNTNIKVFSIGGNPIPCHTFVDIGIENVSEIKFNISTERLNYHSENVNGITCKTDTKGILQASSNNNFTQSIDNFTYAIKELRESIDGFANRTTNTENVIKNNFVNVATAVDRLVSHSNKTQMELDHYLKMIADLNNETHVNLKHVDDESEVKNVTSIIKNIAMLGKANDEAREELRNIVQNWKDSLEKGPEKDRSIVDIKVLLYFISMCMALILVTVVCAVLYVLVRKGSLHSNFIYNSSHPITNTMEME